MCALASLGPWNDITPQFFTSAAEGGARLGLAARAQDTEESSAADRLKLAYTQLASQEKIASAKAQQEMNLRSADLLLRAHANAGLQQYRADQAQNAAAKLAETIKHNRAIEGGKTDEATSILMKQNARDLSDTEKALDKIGDQPATEEDQKAADALRTKAIYLRGQIKPQKKRVSVIGPNGRKGTVEEGTKLPEGWTFQ